MDARVSGGKPISGANMDRVVATRAGRRLVIKIVLVALAAMCLIAAWVHFASAGVVVRRSEIQIESVAQGKFHDELNVRAAAEPVTTVFLDAVDGGRVSAVFVADGAAVKKGDQLFRLLNAQLQQQQLQRESEVAQQVANLVAVRTSLEASRSDFRRRLSDLEFELSRARKTHERNESLAQRGFVTTAIVEESLDRLHHQSRLLEEARQAMKEEIGLRESAVEKMERALNQLRRGFQVSQRALDDLNVKAPIDGRLADFHLKDGESVKPGDKLGRIDGMDGYKLVASVDEFHLARISPGQSGIATIDGQGYDAQVARINPQVKDGRFTAELTFTRAAPSGLQPGQGLDIRLVLSQPSEALLVSDGPFLTDSGGTWAYVLDADGKRARKRAVQLGRRSAGKIEVVSGLRAGDQIIVSGYGAFKDSAMLSLQ